MNGKYGFTAPQVSDLLSIPYTTLDLWVRNGFFVPSLAKGRGRGTRRLYSKFDIVILKVVSHFRNQGINNELLSYLISNLRDHQKLIETSPDNQQVLISDGQTIFAIVKDIYEMVDYLMMGKPVWSIPIGRVVESLLKEIKDKNIEPTDMDGDSKVKVG